MGDLPVVKPKQALRALLKAGFYIDRQRGSHVALRHEDRYGTVTVPLNKKDIKPKTLRSIIDQAGLRVEEFVALLKK